MGLRTLIWHTIYIYIYIYIYVCIYTHIHNQEHVVSCAINPVETQRAGALDFRKRRAPDVV